MTEHYRYNICFHNKTAMFYFYVNPWGYSNKSTLELHLVKGDCECWCIVDWWFGILFDKRIKWGKRRAEKICNKLEKEYMHERELILKYGDKEE